METIKTTNIPLGDGKPNPKTKSPIKTDEIKTEKSKPNRFQKKKKSILVLGSETDH